MKKLILTSGKLALVSWVCLFLTQCAPVKPTDVVATPDPNRPVFITAGGYHTCVLTMGAGVKCWGENSYGELGNGSTTSSSTPVEVSGSSDVTAIAAGAAHTCALIMGAGVECWGGNPKGLLGDGSTTDRTTPVEVSGLSSGATAITAGDSHTCALTTDGGVKCWGWNPDGQLGDDSLTNSSKPVDVSGLSSGVMAIAAGFAHTCALAMGGGVKCWGRNEQGQLGNGSLTNSSIPVDVSGLSSGITAITVGGGHTCALTMGGGVKCWGYNLAGQLGNGSLTNSSIPVDVSGLSSGVMAITAGQNHTCALTMGAGVKCWGSNAKGQLGDGSTTDRATPVDVSGLSSGVTAIAAGGWHTCALTMGAGIKCWGSNENGQLGNGTTTNSTTPADVIGFGATPRAVPTGNPTPTPTPHPEITYLKMIDAKTGWAVIASNNSPFQKHLVRTTDGGSTWEDVTPAQVPIGTNPTGTYYLHADLFALNQTSAWFITGSEYAPGNGGSIFSTVWRTEDGGHSWKPGNPIILSDEYSLANGISAQLQFVDPKHGWLRVRLDFGREAFYDKLFRTGDGGMNWEELPEPGCSDTVMCTGLTFVDENTGFMEIDGLYKTTDGGRTWQSVDLPHLPEVVKTILGSERQYDARFISSDNGQTWHWVPVSGPGPVFFLDAATGWRFSSSAGGYALERTGDGGVTWQKIADGLPWSGELQFTDGNMGWAVVQHEDRSSQLLRTADGGRTWADLTPNLFSSISIPAIAVPAISATQIPSELPAVPPAEPWFARMDAGARIVLNSIQMMGTSNGWGTSLNGYIFHTTDGGSTWRDVTPRYGQIVSDRGFFALDAAHAWTVVTALPACLAEGSQDQCPDYYLKAGEVWSTTDAGQTWHPTGVFPGVGHPFGKGLMQIQFLNANTGWVQFSHFLMRTTDAGVTWQPQMGQEDGRDIYFVNERVAFRDEAPPDYYQLWEFFNGSSVPVLSKTTDGGVTWEPVKLSKILINPEGNLDKPGIDELLKENVNCDVAGLHSVGLTGIGFEYICGPAGFPEIIAYYLSPDEGKSWNGWVSTGNEYFLDGHIGWRLFTQDKGQPSQLQQTTNGGRTWTPIKTVAWQAAQFDFITEQVGWAVVTTGDVTALVHTSDGGRTWTELKPVVAKQ